MFTARTKIIWQSNYFTLFNSMTQNEYDTEENIIMGGDLNCPLNPTLDKKGSIIAPPYSVINSIENIKNTFSLHDIWRIKNPNTRSFTWSRCKPFIFCRLDFWLISDKLHDLVTNVDIYWLLLKLITLLYLAKIGYVQSDSCTFCGMCRETRDHLFFLCSFSEKFWNEFANYWLLV